MNNQELLQAKLEELKREWFAETHRGDDMDLNKLHDLEKEISRIEDLIIRQ